MMKVYEFGDSGSPAIFVFLGTGRYWKLNFGTKILPVTDTCRVCDVSYDSFNETEDSIPRK